MREWWIGGRLVAAALLWAGLAAGRSAAEEGTVTGTGTVEVKRLPDVMRVFVGMKAKGKDLKEALARLKERRDIARTSLTSLGAIKGTVEFGDTALAQKSDREMRAEMMARRGRPTPKGPKSKTPPVEVAASIRADFAIKAADPEALLFAVHELQEKVRAADLAGLKDVGKLSPEEEEIAEEMVGRDEESDGPNSGKPAFVFVATVSEQDRDKALAEAFQKAKREAARLAAASGSGLGPLRQLRDMHRSGMEEFDAYRGRMRSEPFVRQVMGDDEKPSEAVGYQPGPVTLRIAIAAQFALRPSAER